MDYRILGPLEVSADGRPVTLGGDKQRALLAILLLRRNHLVSADRLIDDMWGEATPATALRTLQVYVSRLRKALNARSASSDRTGDFDAGSPRDPLLTRARGYMLQLAPGELDLDRFVAMAERGRDALAQGKPSDAASLLREALGLWRGPPLADFTYERFAQGEIRRLEELHLAALEARIDADLELGYHAQIIGELEGLLAEHPGRDRLARQLMLALYRSGRQTDALDVYQRMRVYLAEEFGLEPGPGLRLLQRQILEQSPDLQAPAPAPRVQESSRRETTPQAPEGPLARGTPPAQESAPPRSSAGLETQSASRRIVTALCAGVSPPAGLDPESLDDLMTRYFEQARAAVTRHAGSMQPLAGGELVAVFGLERVREDDALRALRAAAELRDALARQLGLEPKIALGSGQVLAGGPDRGVTGYPVMRASALQRTAKPGEILLTAETHKLVRGAAEVSSAVTDGLRLERFDPRGPTCSRLRADVGLDMARVLSALGRHEEASAEAQAALELFKAKGSVPGMARARSLLRPLAAA